MTGQSAPRNFKPYPEIVESDKHDAPYEIIDTHGKDWLPTNGMVDKVRRRLLVPLTVDGRPVSLHELGHVRWSPTRLPSVPYDKRILLAVEDARINMGLEHKDLPVRLSADDRKQVTKLAAEDLKRRDVKTFVLRAIASIGTDALHSVLEPAKGTSSKTRDLAARLVGRVRSRLLRARRRVGGPVASFEVVLRVAGSVARELGVQGLADEPNASHRAAIRRLGCCMGDAPDPELDIRRILAGRRGLLGAGRGRTAGAGREAAGMKIVTAPLDVACPDTRGGTRDWRPATEGTVIRYPGRYCIDRAIFRRLVRRRGGSVLVDTSGSMSLDANDIERILRGAPAATLVAMYSGSGKKGELRVVARDGRRATAKHLEPFGPGNIVDTHALAWLAKQPAPRVWISDGHVTGVGDVPSPAIKRRCKEICRRAAIRRVTNVEDAARVLEGRARVPRLPTLPDPAARLREVLALD
jgi:hypothetical protein